MLCRHLGNILLIILLSLFMITVCHLWMKYSEKRISITTKEEESIDLQYPSVTVCPVPASRDRFEAAVFNLNTSMDSAEQIFKESIWKMNETFYFVNQKHPLNPGYPCMTSSQGLIDPGKPCIFPFSLLEKNTKYKNRYTLTYFYTEYNNL